MIRTLPYHKKNVHQFPKEAAGAGVGVGMLRGGGDSLTCKSVLVLGVLVSKFHSFKTQKRISCLLIDIDPISPKCNFMFSGRF